MRPSMSGAGGDCGRHGPGSRRACALWDRVFARPAQTDAGWPKKVSRRVQEAITDDPARAEAMNHCWGPCALAGVRAKPSLPHRGKQNLPEHARAFSRACAHSSRSIRANGHVADQGAHSARPARGMGDAEQRTKQSRALVSARTPVCRRRYRIRRPAEQAYCSSCLPRNAAAVSTSLVSVDPICRGSFDIRTTKP